MLHRRRDCRYNECSYACPDMAPTLIHFNQNCLDVSPFNFNHYNNNTYLSAIMVRRLCVWSRRARRMLIANDILQR